MAWPKVTSVVSTDAEIETRIDEILAQMSVEEKVGQMIQPEIKQVTAQDIKQYHIGSVLNGGGSVPNNDRYAKAAEWVALADTFFEAAADCSDGKVYVPMMWGTDAVHGVGNVVGATLFPHNIALGATGNPDLIRQIGEVTAREIAAIGIDWDFSPTVAVARDDRWGRTYESYSEDPEIVRAYAGKMVEGLQGAGNTDEFLNEQHVIATAKHFIGDGGTINGIDRGDCMDNEEDLCRIHGAGYISAIEAGVQSVMASFNSWHGEKLHGHKHLLTTVLKESMGFDGLVVGDWNGHGFIEGASVLDCPQAINAGLDIFMVPDPDWKVLFDNTVAQINSGVIPLQRANDAVRRILRVKLRAGLFEREKPSQRPLAGRDELIGAPEHRAVARQAVRESLVMLKNKNNLLPLKPNQRVLVAGEGADNLSKQAGGWSVTWQGTGTTRKDFPGSTSILEGIQNVVGSGGGQVEYSADGEYTEKPDVAIVVWGEAPYAEMQGDVQNLLYKESAGRDWELLKKLKAQGIPVVSLFLTGRPLWVNRELNASDAFVVIWTPGTEGAGVGDVIFTSASGEVAHPMKGKLTFSWPGSPDQGPLNRGDAEYAPLFAYGFGLSYGEPDTLDDNLPEEFDASFEAMDEMPVFNRRPIDPFEIIVEGCKNDRATMVGNVVETTSITVSAVDREVQEDARRAVWNGLGEGFVALSTRDRQVMLDYLENDGALIFDLKVDSAPSAEVVLRLGCGPNSNSDLNITDTIKDLVGKDWMRVTVPLNLFPDVGSDFGLVLPPEEFFYRILEPFTLVTEGTLDLRFSFVQVQKYLAGKGIEVSKS
ncbi:glycoside hydrolase family 3 N-terminal domain-containing protein [Gilvimarinus sp. SDUM040013]|uniref:Glycoside hydrolase family 3 N-terminal domain-containing protein n=1 Tax=Gilvimarinus gilvus TaxID=3058038 RepID=A0ABU4RZK3_9GAMM|nr:glycoside hydrolase family 3 N-terminal domain-containing protein [Gilvimarinus sp. SDUM040013]MDO3386127.1 glycoside hydrolase family 3 N-terminal domain-containing protein [Gilvimarinus sp. SDUM040013]MDX6850332.1 glycoside hydrolase family 3 N-terminal domain-containing protein [Gilvimarinus sp. SDUM040013]